MKTTYATFKIVDAKNFASEKEVLVGLLKHASTPILGPQLPRHHQ